MNKTIRYSKKFLSESFQKSSYQWKSRPPMQYDQNYGIYINIPFCRSFCAFCPFYKVKYNASLVEHYVHRLVAEIEAQPVPGNPTWIYMGGGTPNLLKIEQLGKIVSAIKKKCDFHDAGIELMPGILNKEYLNGLKLLGFNKISLGVESMSKQVNQVVKRTNSEPDQIHKLVNIAHQLNLFVNIDLMVGLQEQSRSGFMEDVMRLSELRPSQITMYPFMMIRGFRGISGIDELEQFAAIEDAVSFLASCGYTRLSPWTCSMQKGEYDCSKAELINDYIGFGAGSFSTNGDWKVVNPPVNYYLDHADKHGFKALVSAKSAVTDDWRKFGSMLSKLEISNSRDLHPGIRAYVAWLKLTGNVKSGKLTPKGMNLAHHLMKTIVESLPFPLQDMTIISNSDQYMDEVKRSDQKLDYLGLTGS